MQEEQSLDKSPERIRRMFDGIAPRYDFLNHFLSGGIDRCWRRKTAERLLTGEMPTGPILDVCCGTGDLTVAFRRRIERLSLPAQEIPLFGVDFSPKMIALAAKKVRDMSQIAFSIGDALNLPFEPESFVIVANAFGLRNVGDTERGIAEMVRVCRKGGTVAILDFSMPELPILSHLYRFYFLSVLPRIGRFFSSHDSAYRYLPESVLTFDPVSTLLSRMERHGLVGLETYRMTWGIATLLLGRKPFESGEA